jgi:integrase
MARQSDGPWYRKSKNAFYATVAGKKVPLAKCGPRGEDDAEARAKARTKWHGLMLARDAAVKSGEDKDEQALAVALEAFLEYAEGEYKPKTVLLYTAFLQGLIDHLKGQGLLGVQVRQFGSAHMDRWLASKKKTWGKATRRIAITVVCRALNYAVKRDLITRNLVRNYEKPPIVSRGRESVIPRGEYEMMLAASEERFRWFLIALWHTGARPGEVASVEAKDYDRDAGAWVLKEHKTDAVGRDRVIHLTPTMVDLTEKLCALYPEGKLFRNRKGNPWVDSVIGKRFGKLRERLKLKSRSIAYGFRHAFATAQLAAGTPDTHVAALLGHTSTAMVHKHYSHIAGASQVLRDALKHVKPAEGEKV